MRVITERTTTVDGDGNEVVDYAIADHLRPHVLRYTTEGGVTYAELDAAAVAVESTASIESALEKKGVVTLAEITAERVAAFKAEAPEAPADTKR